MHIRIHVPVANPSSAFIDVVLGKTMVQFPPQNLLRISGICVGEREELKGLREEGIYGERVKSAVFPAIAAVLFSKHALRKISCT